MPIGKMQDLPPPPTTQEEVRRSPFRKAFEHSQKVELNGLLAVGCFKVVDEKDVPKCRKNCRVSMVAHVQGRWTWKLPENKIQSGCERVHSSPGCRLSRDNVPHAYISAHKNDSRDCERERFARFSPRCVSGVRAGAPCVGNLYAPSPRLR